MGPSLESPSISIGEIIQFVKLSPHSRPLHLASFLGRPGRASGVLARGRLAAQVRDNYGALGDLARQLGGAAPRPRGRARERLAHLASHSISAPLASAPLLILIGEPAY